MTITEVAIMTAIITAITIMVITVMVMAAIGNAGVSLCRWDSSKLAQPMHARNGERPIADGEADALG
jgi:hypothetical protein